MYQVTNRRKLRHRRRSRFWLGFTIVFLVIVGVAIWQFLHALHQKPVIVQSKPHVTKLSYAGKTKHYNMGDFAIDIPNTWQLMPSPQYGYKSFTWATTEKADNLSIEIFEDNLPTNFAPNKVLVISGSGDHVEISGQVSDNCINFTPNENPAPGYQGVPAKWQNVNFLCNRATATRDVIATASTDGINFVRLTKTDTTAHKFLFTFNSNQISADYTPFYNALTSFTMN